MPRVVLVRHAKSDYPWGVEDHDRPLNDRGRRDAPEIGAWLDAHVTWGDEGAPAVRVSTARRAQLTWGLATSRLGERWQGIEPVDEPRIYEAPVTALRAVVADARADTVVLVGHNPGLADFVHAMAVDDEARRQATAKFPTSAVAVLETDLPLAEAMATPGSLRVTAFAVPRG